MSAISSEELLQRVIRVVAVEACVSPSNLTADTVLESLGMDSLDFVALMQALDIPQAKWNGINTISDLAKALSDD